MKKLSTLLIMGLSILSYISCTKNLSDLNENGKRPSSVSGATLFTYGEKQVADIMSSPSVSLNVFRTIAQEWTENTYVYAARYIFSAYTPQSTFWNYCYDNAIYNLQDAKNNFASSVSDQDVLRNDLIVADLLQIYTFHLLTATYGDIPYSEATNKNIPFAKYDSSLSVYKDLLYRLDTCISGINTSAESLGSADQIYAGDMASWKKFAASLKLKIAMELADYDATMAKSQILSAIQTGVFGSNEDNATFAYGNNATINSSPIWQAMVQGSRRDFCPDSFVVATLKNWNDPRLSLYINPATGGDSIGKYVGGISGSSNDYAENSTFSSLLLGQVYPAMLLDYQSVEFLLAEAVERGIEVGGTAQSHYNNAITASIEFWGGTQIQANTYLSYTAVNYTSATGNWKQKLGYQKWLANFNNGWDAWTDIRRLGYPNINTVSPPNGAITTFPLRFAYPSSESGSNSTNWSEAVANLPGGTDVVTAKLFWME